MAGPDRASNDMPAWLLLGLLALSGLMLWAALCQMYCMYLRSSRQVDRPWCFSLSNFLGLLIAIVCGGSCGGQKELEIYERADGAVGRARAASRAESRGAPRHPTGSPVERSAILPLGASSPVVAAPKVTAMQKLQETLAKRAEAAKAATARPKKMSLYDCFSRAHGGVTAYEPLVNGDGP